MSFISNWKDKIAHYIEVRLNLLKVGLVERISGILSYLVFVFIGLFLSLSVLIFLGIGLGEYFGSLLDSRAGGFFITAGCYIFLLIVLFLLRTPVTRTFSGIFIRIMTASEPEEDTAAQKPEKNRERITVD